MKPRPLGGQGRRRRGPVTVAPEVTRSAPPKKRADVNPRTNPNAAGPPAPVPKPHGRRNQNVFTTPLAQQPFHKQQREAARHVARAILEVTGKAPRRPLRDEEVRQVLHSEGGREILRSAEAITRQPEHKQSRGIFHAAVGFLKGGGGLRYQAGVLPAVVGFNPFKVQKTAAEAAVQTGRATYEDPVGVSTKTAGGLGQFAVGAVAAIPELVIRTASGTAHGDPLQGVRSVVDQAAKDVSRRYGALYRDEPGAERQFRERIKKEGAASELVDAAAIAVPEGAIIGRGLGRAARAGALGERAGRLATEARPALRISGDEVVQQDLSRNLIRAGAQRAEDATRRRATERRNTNAGDQGRRGLQPGEGEVVKTTLRGQARAQRVAASKLQARIYQAFKNEQAHELDRGARRNVSRLSRKQLRAVVPALQGIVTPDNPALAVAQLRTRNRQIEAEIAADNAARRAKGIDERRRPTNIHEDELRLNEWLIRHADEIFTPDLARFQAEEAQRSIRVGGEVDGNQPAFKSLTAEVRRLRPQGNALGISYAYDDALAAIDRRARQLHARAKDANERARVSAERQAALAELEKRKPAMDRAYVAEVRQRAREHHLPEPAYVPHHSRSGELPRSDYAPGGARAIAAPHRSQFVLHRLGLADTHPERYLQGVARAIKYRHNWRGVADQAERASVRPREVERLAGASLERILGRRKVNVDALSIEDWRRILHSARLNPRDWAFWNPARHRISREQLQRHGHELDSLELGTGELPPPGLEEGWHASAVDDARLRKLGPEAEALVKTRGWKLLPRAAYDEITASTNPSGFGGRLLGKAQGFQSRVLLGLNPSWLQVQAGSNAFLGGLGVAFKHGGPHHFITAPVWYRRLPDDAKKIIDEHLGSGIFTAHGERTHLGAAGDDKAIVQFVHAIAETPAGKVLAKGNLPGHAMNLMFGLDNAQNNYFRRVVLYSALKRQAFEDMGRQLGHTVRAQQQIAHMFSIKDPQARMEAIVRNQPLFEKHAEFVNEMLGDWSRYTARERRTLKRAVLFYGFFRFSLRTLFYTLPVKHPIAAVVTAKLAQLHNEEVKDLLGGDQAPWAYSRIFFEKNGKLNSIDLGRANPVTNPIVSIATEGPRAIGGLFSPAAQAIADQIYGRELYSDRGFRVKGSAAENSNPDLVSRARIFGNQLASTAFPLRELAKVTQGNATQGDDALPFSARPIEYKTAQAQSRENDRRKQKGSITDQITRDLVPLFVARPDNSRDVVAQRQREAGAPVTVPSAGTNDAAVHPDSIDWSKVQIPDASASIDWSKVRIP